MSERFYDLSGSATHLLVIAVSLVYTESSKSPRQVFLSLASLIWLTRLGSFLYLRIEKDGRDERFNDLKRTFVSWTVPWIFQAAWVTLIQAPVILMNIREDPIKEYGVKDIVTLSVFGVLWIVGFIVECTADNEKFVFKTRAVNKGKFITTGIWKYSRHPNYFGEILMWWCVCIIVVCADFTDWKLYGSLTSPFFTMVLLLGVSGIPMVDAIGLKRWGHVKEYQEYTKNTSLLIPWFPK